MHPFSLLAIFAGTALATPTWIWSTWPPYGASGYCLTDDQTADIIDKYSYLLVNPQGVDFNKTADALLSDKFFVSSDSINTLASFPLGVNAYPSKQYFIAGQAKTPAIPVLKTLGSFHTCNQIAWRWNASSIASNQYEVKGIITMDVNATSLQIDAVYSEFNSGAWLADIGNPECKK